MGTTHSESWRPPPTRILSRHLYSPCLADCHTSPCYPHSVQSPVLLTRFRHEQHEVCEHPAPEILYIAICGVCDHPRHHQICQACRDVAATREVVLDSVA